MFELLALTTSVFTTSDKHMIAHTLHLHTVRAHYTTHCVEHFRTTSNNYYCSTRKMKQMNRKKTTRTYLNVFVDHQTRC